MALHPLFAEILAPLMPPERDTYRGWEIYRGRWPEPDWYAIGPNYDASWEGEEDGWVDNGQKADAPTREALIEEIDIWFEENEPSASTTQQDPSNAR